MKDADKRKIYEDYKVHISHGRWSSNSKCVNCKEEPDKYMVFVGGNQLSNLQDTCCDKCLGKVVDDAIKYRNDLVKDIIKRKENEEVEEANRIIKEQQQILREKKIGRIVE